MNEYNQYTHEYFIDGIKVPSVSEVARYGKTFFFRKGGAERGSREHQLIYQGNKYRETTHESVYLTRWKEFEQTVGLKVVDCEVSLFSKRLMLGGTPDVIGDIAGQRYVIDAKTYANLIGTEGEQTAGYSLLYYETHGIKLPRLIVTLTENSYVCKPCTNPLDEVEFLNKLSKIREERGI